MGGVELMLVEDVGRGKGLCLCVKFKTSRMLPSAIFWWGSSSSSSCDRREKKSTPCLKLKLVLWTGV